MTRVLLDTRVRLWLQASPERIDSPVLKTLQDSTTDVFLSVACGWEIAVKWSQGRLTPREHPSTYVPSRMRSQSIISLQPRLDHVLEFAELPDHHRHPVGH